MLYVPLDTKTGHFGGVLPNRSLSLVLSKLNLTQTSGQSNPKKAASPPYMSCNKLSITTLLLFTWAVFYNGPPLLPSKLPLPTGNLNPI